MNKVMLIGRICNDLKKKYIGDSTVVQVSLAVQRRFKNSKNEYDTDFVQCELWGHNADFLEKNFSQNACRFTKNNYLCTRNRERCRLTK